MKTNNILKYAAFGLCVLMSACKPNLDEYTAPSAGAGNDGVFKKYISVGNSLTAGYANGGLSNAGMEYAYPKLIAKQLESVGGGSFVMPLFSDNESNGSGEIRYLAGFDSFGSPIVLTSTTNSAVKATPFLPAPYSVTVTVMTPYSFDGNGLNNFGVPGIKLATSFPMVSTNSQDAVATGYGNLNGFYLRLLGGSAPGAQTTPYLNFVLDKGNKNASGANEPYTFFSCWLGNNDALGYATTGGSGKDPLTPTNLFAAMYSAAIKSLTQNGTIKGVVATIPDVTSIPFFSAVTVNKIAAGIRAKEMAAKIAAGASATDADASTALHTLYVYDSSIGAGRTATTNDMIVLTFPTSLLGGATYYGLTPLNPIGNEYVLDPTEQATAQAAVASYNATIKSVATAYNLAIFDANALMNQMKATGLYYNGVKVGADYITGGAFSLDGVHLTPRGNAVVANQFITAINAKYGSNIPLLNPIEFSGIKIP